MPCCANGKRILKSIFSFHLISPKGETAVYLRLERKSGSVGSIGAMLGTRIENVSCILTPVNFYISYILECEGQ